MLVGNFGGRPPWTFLVVVTFEGYSSSNSYSEYSIVVSLLAWDALLPFYGMALIFLFLSTILLRILGN